MKIPFLTLWLVCCGFLANVPASFAGEEKRKQPNIIFLLTDDQVDISVGCYGNDQVKTPNMDRLARQGFLFRNHYNTTSICMASRASIMTGMYEYKTGCNFQHGPLSRNAFSLSFPLLLQKAGYFIGFGGKFGFAVRADKAGLEKVDASGLPVGDFDWWAGGPGQTKYKTARNKTIAKYAEKYPHSTRAYGAWAQDFFRAAKKSKKPFCLAISFKAPHLPFTPDPAFDPIYKDTKFRKPANYGKKNAKHLAPQAKTGRQFNSYRFWTKSEATYQEAMRKYNQLIYGVDVTLGMIRKALEDEGLAENTIIIFTSDNGYSCGAHGFGGKVLPYGEASRSPLIIYDPRLPQDEQGQERHTVTGNIDMAPTILDFAGQPIPKNMDGLSLVPLLGDPKGISRKSLTLINMWGNKEIQALSVVTKDWKYIYWGYAGKGFQPVEEMFHIAKDRLEMKNLATVAAHSEKLTEMRDLYDEHFRHLKRHAVQRNKYTKYRVLFDRSVPWNAKASLWRRKR
ncbi:MAG: sulfatase [Gemmataceae bacterium]